MNEQKAWYDLKFEIAFRKEKGDSFQEFFEKLMSLAYKADFMACRPWGKVGDRKNDGFLKSERRLFQVYAPAEMKAGKAIAKIKEDFEGAKTYWNTLFDKWVFAHNAVDGLPPHVLEVLLEFEKENQEIKIEPWGLEEFRVVFRKLSSDDLQTWFGFAPSAETSARLGFEDLKIVLDTIASRTPVQDQLVKDVPRGKIQANALSDDVACLLKAGMTKAPMVEEFLNRWHDVTLGERIADSFKEYYDSLRGTMNPNQIFAELQTWAGGHDRGTAEHELAVLTVTAYYFERCDIYEEPRSET